MTEREAELAMNRVAKYYVAIESNMEVDEFESALDKALATAESIGNVVGIDDVADFPFTGWQNGGGVPLSASVLNDLELRIAKYVKFHAHLLEAKIAELQK